MTSQINPIKPETKTNPELKRARLDTERATDQLDKSIDELKNKISETIDSVKDPLQNAESFLTESIEKAANEAFRVAEEHPISTWFTIFLSGCALGALLSKYDSGSKKVSKRSAA